MKCYSFGAMLAAGLGLAVQTSHAALFPPYNNTVALWLMDEGGGTTFYDATTNNNTGALTAGFAFNNSVKQFGPSSVLGTPSFSVQGGYVPDSVSLHALTNNFTVEGWFNLQSFTSFPTMISREDAATNGTAWAMGINGANKIEVDLYDATNRALLFVRDSIVFPTNQFIHMAFTFSNGVLDLYRNGVLITAATNTGIHPAGVGQLLVGDDVHANGPGTGNSFPWRGYIDEVRLSDIVRVPGDGSGTNNFLAWNGSLIPEPATTAFSVLAAAWLLLPVTRKIRN